MGTFWMPEGASTMAGEIDWLFYLVYWISVVIFIGVVSAMVYFAIRYRRKDENHIPPVVHESKLLEAAMIVVPLILCMIVFTFGFKSYLKLNIAPPQSYVVEALASQWKWDFTYPNGKQVTGELHVPEGRPVQLKMTSMDVLHSFFVPQFRVKQDVIPNRYSSVWFQATRADSFDVFCTEYCGTSHSGMLARVIVHPQDEFDQWLEAGDDRPLAVQGESLFRANACNSCHTVDGSRLVGPSIQGLFGSERQFADGTSAVADEEYLRTSIVAPASQIVESYPNVMPATYASLRPDDVSKIIEYIKTVQ
ncbi:MAG: cytochrome c oxidase subunit II [Rhodothermales bacterium]|nr:cytochrome c oxidase subunit II [Rhodothermales bacterium]